MNPIHDLSAITPLPEFDLFAVPPTQTTVEKDICFEYRPISTLDSKSTIEFVVDSNIDEYINFRESFLFIKLQFVLSKLDKEAVTENDWNNVNVVNNLMHSLFKHMDFFIGERQINSSSTTYPYRSYLESFLYFDEESKNTYLQSAGWFKDESNRQNQITPNGGDKSIGKVIDLMGRLHMDLCFQDRALIGGTSIRLKLVPHELKFILNISDVNIIPTIKILECSWFVHKSKISKEIVDAHRKALAIAPVKYPITRIEVKSFTISKGALDCSIENSIHGQLPRRLYIAFVSNEAYNGSFTKNPFNFEDFGLKFLCCYIDGVQFPTKAFTPNFAQDLFNREYMSLFQSTNQVFGKVTTILKKSEYKNGNVIYGINFAPDLSDGCSSGHLNLLKKGTLRIEVHFEKGLKETINLILFCEFDNIIQIGEDRIPITDYN